MLYASNRHANNNGKRRAFISYVWDLLSQSIDNMISSVQGTNMRVCKQRKGQPKIHYFCSVEFRFVMCVCKRMWVLRSDTVRSSDILCTVFCSFMPQMIDFRWFLSNTKTIPLHIYWAWTTWTWMRKNLIILVIIFYFCKITAKRIHYTMTPKEHFSSTTDLIQWLFLENEFDVEINASGAHSWPTSTNHTQIIQNNVLWIG